eukprot:COSAG01_NODE_552_length_15569_cov_37.676123_3_plen_210_part_00
MVNLFRMHGEALGTSATYRYLMALLAPVLCAVFMVIGFEDYEIEDQVSRLWIPDSSDYAADDRHRDEHSQGSTSTQFLVTARPRDGTSNVLTTERLLEHNTRMNLVYATTVTVDGVKYSYDDFCQNPSAPYVLPCFKITALDCFYEGGSVMSPQGLAAWRTQAGLLLNSSLTPYIMKPRLLNGATKLSDAILQVRPSSFCASPAKAAEQ